MAGVFSSIKKWFKETAEWVQENLGDPYIVEAIRDDLGLAEGESVPEAQRDQIKQFADGVDPDKEGFAETVADLKVLVDAFVQMGEGLLAQPPTATGWDVAYLIGRLLAAEIIRTREPIVYFLGKSTLFIVDDPERLSELDPALLVRLGKGEPMPAGYGELVTQRISGAAALLIVVTEQILDKFVGPDLLDAYYGWDPAPDSPTPVSDLVSARTLTLIFSLPEVEGVTPRVALTMTGVPPEHSGPGMYLSVGGSGTYEKKVEQETFTIQAGAASALDMFIPFSDAAHDFELGSGGAGFFKFSLLHAGDNNEPALRIGEKDKTRLDIDKLGVGIDLLADRAGVRLFMKDADLIIKLGEGDGFLQQLPGGEIKLRFNFALTADTVGGFRVEGGTSARATIPVEKSIGGVVNVHTVDVALAPSTEGYDAALEIATSLGLKLGAFRASVDRIGLQFQFAFRQGNLGFLDVALGFKPPNGIGLLLDVGIVRGGGYLFFDHARGEYGGALELKIGAWGIKAIGLLTTKMPDGSDGWALVLLIYAEMPRFHIAFGIFFDGIGGMIGLHHTVDIGALQDDMPKGAFDDILFPANPVGDAPRIINRLRVIFPIKRNALTVGLMFRLSWGTPRVGEIKLGLILAIDNAFGEEDASLSKILLLGQLRLGLPETKSGDVVRIIVDFMGYLDFDNKRFGFYARLRNSRLVSVLELTGSLVLVIDYGEHPTFVVAAGGFHPRFKDLPTGLPAKLDRLGVKFKIAKIVEITINCYVAVTSATVQFGAEAKLKVDLDPVRIEGYLGFDALIYYKPEFRFEVDFRAGMAIKVFGETLKGIDVSGTLYGPGHWRIKGSAKFSILFWDFHPKFDEEWGDRPTVSEVSTNVAALVAADYRSPDNWSAALPAGSDTLVTLSALPGDTGVIAHPLGTLRVTQKTAPLGLTLEKFGETIIEGPNRFDLTEVRVGETVITQPAMTQEHLARGQYLNLSDEQKLSQPSFENFDVGVAVGTQDYRISAVVANGDLSYETKYLTPGEGDDLGILVHATLAHAFLTMDVLAVHAEMGAAAQSGLRFNDRLRGGAQKSVQIGQPPLVAVNEADLGMVGEVAVNGRAAQSVSLMEQALRASGVRRAQIVEAFEINS